MKAVREEEVKLRGRVGFVKELGFKPAVQREGVLDEQSGETKDKEVMGEGIGEYDDDD